MRNPISSFTAALVFVAAALSSPVVSADATTSRAGTYISGKEELALPGGKKLMVEQSGAIWLDGVLVYSPGPVEHRVQQWTVEVIGDQLNVVLGLKQQDANASSFGADVVIAKASLATGKPLWHEVLSPPFQNRSLDDWSVLFDRDHVFVRQRERVCALDAKTGKLTWTVRGIDVAFDEPYVNWLEVQAQNKLFYESIALVGDRLVARGKMYAMNAPFVLELDAKTGARVHVETKYAAPVARPLFAYLNAMQPLVHDGPLPTPPPHPPGWDGLLVGLASLYWNTTTGEGIILNPLARDRDAIVAAAKQQHYTDGNGISQPVRWLFVADTLQLVLGKVGMPAPAGLRKYPDSIPKNTVKVQYRIDIAETGDRVDAAGVAKALGTRVFTSDIPTPIPTSAGPISPVRQKGASGVILLFWGPLLVMTDDQRGSMYVLHEW